MIMRLYKILKSILSFGILFILSMFMLCVWFLLGIFIYIIFNKDCSDKLEYWFNLPFDIIDKQWR